MEKSKNILFFSVIVLALLAMGCSRNYDSFAKCLTDNGVKFYGAYWCPHCADQKEMFGSSFANVNYIECSLPNRAGQTEECKNAEIKSYPTWEFNDGTRQQGVLSLEKLSSMSGCSLE